MTEITRELLERALQLTPTERALLVAELVASLDGSESEDVATAEWAVEIERRIREMPPVGAPLRDADEVFARLRTHLSERRQAR